MKLGPLTKTKLLDLLNEISADVKSIQIEVRQLKKEVRELKKETKEVKRTKEVQAMREVA